MATTIITCSIPNELATFLAENPEISPSKVIQMQLFRMRDDEAKLSERLKAYEIRVSRISGKLNAILAYCESQNFAIPENVLA